MIRHSTARFTSTIAAGTSGGADWRDITRQLLESYQPDPAHTLGILYITDTLVPDVPGMLDLIRSVTGIDHWVGTCGLGVCGNGAGYFDAPAAVMMTCAFAPEDFKVFPVTDATVATARAVLDPWLDSTDAMLALVHGDPLSDSDPARVLAELERLTGGFLTGGIASSRGEACVIADGIGRGGIGGVVFSSDVAVATTLTQGCTPLGPVHTVTRSEHNIVLELDGARAFDVFAEDLKTEALRRSGEDDAKITKAVFGAEAEEVSGLVKTLFTGDIHVALPVAGSDQRDYMVRALLGVDPDTGGIVLPQAVEQGQHVMFVHRDAASAESDLARALADLQARIVRERGQFAPAGALYISCVARAGSLAAETRLLSNVLGDVPWAGFYANGEISNQRLYAYTGVLILFL